MRSLFLLSTLFLALAACGDDSSTEPDLSVCPPVTCGPGTALDTGTCTCKAVVDMAKHD
jgi:hypothetical protein